MGTGTNRAVKQLTGRTPLTPKQQRRLWARQSAIVHMLKKKGIFDEDDLAELSRVRDAMERDIEQKIATKLKSKGVP